MFRFRHAALLVPFALFALSGCGGGGGGATATASSTANADDSQVKFAQCLRQHGLQVNDPKPGDPGVQIHSTLGKQQMDAAMQACRKYSPKKLMNPNDPKARDNMLKMAQCLRAHGVQVADPQPGQGLQVRVTKGDSTTQKAMETCRKLVPPPSGATPHANGGN